jgi:hypothetical protein
MKMSKEALKKMQMPKAGGSKDDMFDMEASEKEFGDQPAEDPTADDEAGAGKETPGEESKELQAMPDEQLFEELKRRGYDVEHAEAQEESKESPEEESAEDSGQAPESSPSPKKGKNPFAK